MTSQPPLAFPPPPEKSNLLIVRSGCPRPPSSPPAPRRSPNQMTFHKIDPESLIRVQQDGVGGLGAGGGALPTQHPVPRQGESLGQGSFTHIYKGIKRDQKDDEFYQTPVVLKVMDSSHRNCSEVSWGGPSAPTCPRPATP